ncbi:MAG: preprotein translocase subunit SecE [Acidobacteriaceae bacterium]|nr:preprotein translocase subunit SecE [Acidobacteriaceae bacterium]
MATELSKAGNWPQQTKAYIDDVKGEMRHVSWPNWKQVRATTGVVIAAVFLFAAYFAVVDTVVNSIVNRIINYFVRHQ